jgi:hypothetical protein
MVCLELAFQSSAFGKYALAGALGVVLRGDAWKDCGHCDIQVATAFPGGTKCGFVAQRAQMSYLLRK